MTLLMKNEISFYLAPLLTAFSLLLGGCSQPPRSAGGTSPGNEIETGTSNKLVQIWYLLRMEIGDSDHYPKTLNGVKFSSSDANLFVVPGTGSRPGQFENVEDWMDYIYVG